MYVMGQSIELSPRMRSVIVALSKEKSTREIAVRVKFDSKIPKKISRSGKIRVNEE